MGGEITRRTHYGRRQKQLMSTDRDGLNVTQVKRNIMNQRQLNMTVK